MIQFVAVFLISATTTFAGEQCLSGFDCSNACPLAKSANTRLATGHESVSVSETVRAENVHAVLSNMESI